MFRMPLIALLSMLLAVPVLAQSAALSVDLEAVAVKIMLKAFQVGDHDTVETLFDKLSLESKKQFLYKATEIATVDVLETVTKNGGDLAALPFPDMMYMSMFAMHKLSKIEGDAQTRGEIGGEYIGLILSYYMSAKQEQTRLLGHLMASLLEQ